MPRNIFHSSIKLSLFVSLFVDHYKMLNTNAWVRHSVEKNVGFMQNMSCSLPSPETIHASRFMREFMQNTVRRHADYPYP